VNLRAFGHRIDSAGTAWVANFNGNSVTGLRAGGTALSGSAIYGNTKITVPSGIALDSNGNVYVTSGTKVGKLSEAQQRGFLISQLSRTMLIQVRGGGD